jgi:hypothetical protein
MRIRIPRRPEQQQGGSQHNQPTCIQGSAQATNQGRHRAVAQAAWRAQDKTPLAAITPPAADTPHAAPRRVWTELSGINRLELGDKVGLSVDRLAPWPRWTSC